jgi:hypothetical protein
MEFNNQYSSTLEKAMQRLADVIVEKGYESSYCIHGLNASPTFLEMLRKHVNVTYKERPYPMFPVVLTGAVCGMYRTGALFASFEIDKRGRNLMIDGVRLSIRDDDDRLTDTYFRLKTPEEMPDIQRAKEMMLAKQKRLNRQSTKKLNEE